MKIDVDPTLVERYIFELAEHGAYGETGVWRVVYSPEWVDAQNRVTQWLEDARLETRNDAVGNVWGRLAGSEGGPVIATGSHIDSQNPGGRYDGALGVIAGIVALRTLREQFGEPRRTLEAVSLCEEEASRFHATNFWGSRAIIGTIGPDEPDRIRGYEGETIGEAMRSVGLDPARIPEAARDDIDTFIELHIEQGPVLEHAGLPVGIVTGITGLRHYVVAGAFPMDLRRDPMAGAAEMIAGVIQTAADIGRPAVTTVGRMHVEPNFPAIVPGKVSFTIDARHPQPEPLAQLYASHEALLRAVAERRGLEVSWHTTLDLPPSPSDPATVRLLQAAAAEQGVQTMLMHSGAGHDSQVMASRSKIAMIFVQSKDGRSHTPEEYTSIEHAVMGIGVLAAGLYRLAYT
jgi:allantoate deiminase